MWRIEREREGGPRREGCRVAAESCKSEKIFVVGIVLLHEQSVLPFRQYILW